MERAEAIKLGLKKYSTGRPCKHGHLTERYTDSGACAQCVKNIVTVSAVKGAAARAQIDRETKQIYLFSQESGFPAIKAMVDAMVSARFPDMPADAINPVPFAAKQVSRLTYQIRVRVPVADVEQAYLMGKLLLEPEIVNPKPKQTRID